MNEKITFKVVDRFLKYVKYDTQSDENSSTFPSTEKQKILAGELVRELKEIGLLDAHQDDHGYVMATLESNMNVKVPTIGLIAHLDTAPDVSGKDVKPVIHRKYQGGDIVLSGDPAQIIRVQENPALLQQIGNDIVTSDGTTLLGADNKAGIAEILDAVEYFVKHPEIKHGKIRIAFTPDEEIGRGTKYFDIKTFGADYAYTIDGETLAEIDDETFCADTATIKIKGKNVHPGYAKNKMINSIKIAAKILERLPTDRLSPETTEKREGYLHPNNISGGVEETTIKFLIRDFTEEGLAENEELLRNLVQQVVAEYPGANLEFSIDKSYRNMKHKLDENPQVVEYAMEAVRRSGLEPIKNMIRGGTDGAKLSDQGLLTPNIFTGGHNFHSKIEWISVQDMQKAVEVIINLIVIWAEESK